MCPATIGCGGQGRRRGGARAAARFCRRRLEQRIEHDDRRAEAERERLLQVRPQRVVPVEVRAAVDTRASHSHVRVATEELRLVAGGVEEEDVRHEEVSALVSACCLTLDTATGTVPSLGIVFQKASVWKPMSSP